MATKKESSALKKKVKEEKIDYVTLAKELFEKMKEDLILAENFFNKFDDGVKSSATKSRTSLQDIRNNAKTLRDYISEIKKERGM